MNDINYKRKTMPAKQCRNLFPSSMFKKGENGWFVKEWKNEN